MGRGGDEDDGRLALLPPVDGYVAPMREGVGSRGQRTPRADKRPRLILV
jgi:hypothetical protein